MNSSPGNHGSDSRGIVLTYGVETVAGKLTCACAGAVEQRGEEVAGPGLAVGVDDGVERVQPLLRLVRVGVGELMDVAVEDHGVQSRTVRGVARRYRPVGLAGGAPVPSTSARDHRVHRRGVLGESRTGRVGLGGGARTASRAASGGERATTNQRMEIHGRARGGARRCRRPAPAGRSRWCPTRPTSSTASATAGGCKWEANGWRNSQRKPVANADLWQPLIELVKANTGDVPLGQGPQRRPR